ncbi:GntR family transcriptional regulator [Pedobacter sp. MC2016-05]|uniref:FadR/GntR family transcriptional regulator n=1 Tax=Pedobacter sp. MC2016-05 TaxID=2994474 RepID=UPI0022470CDB|nr:GntR family transcriptional regulator [Pedobacter sp. MC2016-05]MCX2474949.1 GntR family transcriptional regulator [Pedobacter sp. MC2016-05]
MDISNLSKDLPPIISNTMADVVELKLREYLKRKSFKPGDALPKELELAEALGVSRNVLREALSRLRMLGMIETRKKRGMVLARPDILGTFERVLDPLIIDNSTLQDIFELRLVLEMGIADLLYIRKTPKDILELETIAKKEINHDHSFRIKNEIAFHGKLYEMSGNDTLKRFQIMLMPIFDYVVTLEQKPTRGLVSHLDLVEILKSGSVDDFKKGMQAHLQPHFNRLK